jgi:hypothetical protein
MEQKLTLKHAVEPKLAIKIAGAVVLVISPFVVLVLLEIFLSFLHIKTASTYFENEKETLQRNDIVLDKFIDNPTSFKEELKSNKTKIAIFGGSSAAGFAAPIGLGKFIEGAGNGKLVVHNYAEPGSPFVGFQDEILKMVIGFYDVIVIYAGHNEIWSHVYAKSKDRNEMILLPWGKRVYSRGAYLKHSLKLIELRNVLDDNQSPAEKIKSLLLGYAYRASFDSRLLHLLKLTLSPESRASDSSGEVTPLHFYSITPFIDAASKREMVENFAKSLAEIKILLKPTQRLVVSTLLANDLFPPLLDAFDAPVDALSEIEKKAASLYEAAGNDRMALVSKDVSSLPEGAHRGYLEGVVCLDGIRPNDLDHGLDERCLDLARSARGQDAFPARVLPEINSFIRTLAGTQTNLLVIDPEAVLRSQKDQSAYLSYFVDFQHPSSTGHMVIASEILGVLFPTEGIRLSPLGQCDKYSILWAGEQRELEAAPAQINEATQTNMHWLEFFTNVKQLTSPFLYGFYRERAVEKLKKCLPQRQK